jgi:hypothetical protein
LEEVEVAAIHQSHLGRSGFQRFGRIQAAEPAPYDHNSKRIPHDFMLEGARSRVCIGGPAARLSRTAKDKTWRAELQ